MSNVEVTLKEVEVQKLNLQPNDFLVVKVGNSADFDSTYLNSLMEGFKKHLGDLDIKGIFVKSGEENGIDFSVIKSSKTVPVKIKKLHEDAQIPKYATEGSSGFDFHALEDVYLNLGETKLIKTGLTIQVGSGYELQVRPRSGLSLKTGLRINNSPGTVDSDYLGEICIIVSLVPDGHSTVGYQIKKGDRIAQGVICPVVQAEFEVVDELEASNRGQQGLGSTGT